MTVEYTNYVNTVTQIAAETVSENLLNINLASYKIRMVIQNHVKFKNNFM